MSASDEEVELTALRQRVAALEAEVARLRGSEAQHRRILEQAEEGVWEIDAEGRTTFVNPKMAAMLGCTRDEMLGRSVYDFTDEEGRAQTMRNMGRRRDGIRELHEFRFVRPDGTDVWTMLATAPVHDADGRFIGALAHATDITAQRAAALERERQRELAEFAHKLESLAAMSGALAHDFNNTLMAIAGEAALALADAAPGSDLALGLERVVVATESAASLTRQLLAYAGRARFDVRERDLAALLRDNEEALRASLGRRATLTLDVPEGGPPAAVDAAQIQQALTGLVRNAVEAADGGAVGVRVSVEAVDVDPGLAAELLPPGTVAPGAYARLAVADDGPGMDEATRRRIFDPFFSTKARGRGLGLAALLGVVGGHRGGVRVLSEPRAGARFELYLPLAGAGAAELAPAAAPAPHDTRRPRVLIVDDEPVVRDVVGRGLRRLGFEVVLADGGASALTALAAAADGAAPVDVVVLDVAMPGMSGPDLFERLDPSTRPPVLFMSGYAADGRIGDLVGQPGVDFIGKPCRLDEIARRLEALIDAQ